MKFDTSDKAGLAFGALFVLLLLFIVPWWATLLMLVCVAAFAFLRATDAAKKAVMGKLNEIEDAAENAFRDYGVSKKLDGAKEQAGELADEARASYAGIIAKLNGKAS